MKDNTYRATSPLLTICVFGIVRSVVLIAVNGIHAGQPLATGLRGTYHAAVSLGNGQAVEIESLQLSEDAAGDNVPVAPRGATAAAATPAPAAATSTATSDTFSPVHKSTTIQVQAGTTALRTGGGSNSRTILGSHAFSSGTATWTLKIEEGPAIVGVAQLGVDLENYLGNGNAPILSAGQGGLCLT